MPFGLTNAWVVFQHMTNDIFQEYLDHFVVIYLDNILVFLMSMEEHIQQVHLVLTKLRENKLYAKRPFVEFLSYVISYKGITMHTHKFKNIQEWTTSNRQRFDLNRTKLRNHGLTT